MGNATIEAPARGAASTTHPEADDLLSQMADQEIERLLADAHVERSSSPDKPAPAWHVPPQMAKVAERLAEVHETLPDDSQSPSTPVDPAQQDAALAAQIDSVFDEIVGEKPFTPLERRERAEAQLRDATTLPPASAPEAAVSPAPGAMAMLEAPAASTDVADNSVSIQDLHIRPIDSQAEAEAPAPIDETPAIRSEEPSAAITPAAPAQSPSAFEEKSDLLSTFAAIEQSHSPAPAPPADPSPAPTPMAAQLDALFSTLDKNSVAQPAPAEPDFQDATAQAERQLLTAPIEASPAAPALPPATLQASPRATAAPQETKTPGPAPAPATVESMLPMLAAGRTSLPVRILEWINAPLAWCSETSRERIGKVAIVTLLNAILILLYVVFFRK